MSKPKAAKESPEQRALREAEERRIAVMMRRAQAEEAAAGRQLLTRRTRQVMRLFGARVAAAGGIGSPFTPPTIMPPFGGGSNFPLGYGGFGGIGGGSQNPHTVLV